MKMAVKKNRHRYRKDYSGNNYFVNYEVVQESLGLKQFTEEMKNRNPFPTIRTPFQKLIRKMNSLNVDVTKYRDIKEIRQIDLSDRHLEEISFEILYCMNLEKLNLSKNRLDKSDSYPNWINKLEKLNYLDLRFNNINSSEKSILLNKYPHILTLLI